MTRELSYRDITDAAKRIYGKVVHTPVFQSAVINDITGQDIYFKCENFQTIGAFKQRGAVNAIFSLTAEQCRNGVATHSSGNHGAALAYAAAERGIPAYVVMPKDTPRIKRAAVERYGGIITECEPGMRSRRKVLDSVLVKHGALEVHPYDDFRIIAGQGTAALELVDQVPDLGGLVTPVGGGGLLSGSAIVIRERLPGAGIFGVEPERAADTHEAFLSGEVNPVDNPDTIAEGLKATVGSRNLEIIRRTVDDIALVSEAEIVEAMRLVWESLKITIEASSAVAVAPLLKRRLTVRGKVGVILTGGNVDLNALPWL